MLGMKYDMSGAASVLATLQAVAALKLSINVIGVMPCTENMIGHQATRPNDIVKSLKGKTIEITNTDAEGRLILSDALWFSKQYNPQVVIDIATLTGAIVVALGHHYTGLFCNDPALQAALTQAADSIQDPIWPLPLATSYEKDLKSPCADLQNATNKPPAGSIMGALFLQEFIPDCPWAHLDIAGTATVQGKYQHATGRPVPLLIQYLIDQATPSTQ
jgi:leucyl aminopeptidase